MPTPGAYTLAMFRWPAAFHPHPPSQTTIFARLKNADRQMPPHAWPIFVRAASPSLPRQILPQKYMDQRRWTNPKTHTHWPKIFSCQRNRLPKPATFPPPKPHLCADSQKLPSRCIHPPPPLQCVARFSKGLCHAIRMRLHRPPHPHRSSNAPTAVKPSTWAGSASRSPAAAPASSSRTFRRFAC